MEFSYKEFFKDASKEDVEKAIADIVDSSEKDYTKYIYYAIGNRRGGPKERRG